MDYSFNGQAIVSGNLMLPIVGAGTADLFFAEPDAVIEAGQVGQLVTLGTGRLMTVVDAGSDGGYVRARLVSGRGKLDTQLAPLTYNDEIASRIATSSITEAGETVGAGWEQLDIYCARWTRTGTLREALERLCRLTDTLHWRFAEDGSIVLVNETWPDVTENVDVFLPTQSHERCAAWWPTSGATAPGHSIEVYGTDRHLLRVEYDWQDEDVIVKAWY